LSKADAYVVKIFASCTERCGLPCCKASALVAALVPPGDAAGDAMAEGSTIGGKATADSVRLRPTAAAGREGSCVMPE